MTSRTGDRRGEWPLVSAAEMRALDRQTIETQGVPGELLMEAAGRSLVDVSHGLARELAGSSARPEQPIRALCGTGNNGGDGFVAIRHLHAEGVAAEAILLGDPSRLPKDATANWQRLESVGAARRIIDPSGGSFDWPALFAESSVIIDALFGTGLTREISGEFARAIEALNTARNAAGNDDLRVLSVDVPSGLCADTGQVLGAAVSADRTVAISLPKIGLALEPGATLAGEIRVARVGIMDPDPERIPRAELWNAQAAAGRFPTRGRAGHKGSFGHVLVLAGSTGKTGAGALSARAAVRAGAGLVTLAHPIGLESQLTGLPVEVMSAPVAATAEGCFARAGEKAIDELVAACDVVALGPGIGRDAETDWLVGRLVETIERPLVVDADGLNALVGRLDRVAERRSPTVLTPHPGEAARLLETTAAALNQDRIDAARTLASRSGAVVVLKGARTVVADASGRALVIPTGGPSLATGGTGDVLTGIVAALLAAGLSAFDAAGLAAWWHGATADRMGEARVGFGLLASELADALPVAAGAIQEESRTQGALGAKGGDTFGTEAESGGILDLRFPGP